MVPPCGAGGFALAGVASLLQKKHRGLLPNNIAANPPVKMLVKHFPANVNSLDVKAKIVQQVYCVLNV